MVVGSLQGFSLITNTDILSDRMRTGARPPLLFTVPLRAPDTVQDTEF